MSLTMGLHGFPRFIKVMKMFFHLDMICWGFYVSTMNNILSLEKNGISSTRLPIEQFLTYIMLEILNCWKTCGAMTHCFLTPIP
jgi:hypothetical protein